MYSPSIKVKVSCKYLLFPYKERQALISILALYCDMYYIATSPKTHSNQYPNLYPNPNPKQYPKTCPNPNTIAYAILKCCRNIVLS